MTKSFTINQLYTLFPNDASCLEEIKKLRYPKGIGCGRCYKVTKHYKLTSRLAYACEFCRHQVYPLRGTIFDKSSTPLRQWFFVMFLMVATRGKITAKKIQEEIHVTYKTAWRMRQQILGLMKQHRGDLLAEPQTTVKVSFFNAFEITVVQKNENL